LCVAVNAGSSHRHGIYDPRDELVPYYRGKQKRDRILRTTGDHTSNTNNNSHGAYDCDYDCDSHCDYNYHYNGTVVEQVRGRTRSGAHAYHPYPGNADAAVDGAATDDPSVRSIPIPVPLPPALQPRFHDEDYNYNETDDGESSDKDEEQRVSMGKSGINGNNGSDNDNHNGNHNDNYNCNYNDKYKYSEYDQPPRHRHRVRSGVGGPEEFSARLGLVTAALAQLESIVCRVVYLCDDLHPEAPWQTQMQTQTQKQRQTLKQRQTQEYRYRRLTSNSLDLAHRWLPLLDGLGIGGVLGSRTKTGTDTNRCDGDDNGKDGDTGNDNSKDGDSVGEARTHCSLQAILRSAFPLSAHGESSGGTERAEPTRGSESESENECKSENESECRGTSEEDDPTESSNSNSTAQWLFQSIVLNTGSPRTPRHNDRDRATAGSSFVRDHCVLEIAAAAAGARTRTTTRSKAEEEEDAGLGPTVVVPGSLRRNGEFCLIDLLRSDRGNGNAGRNAECQRTVSWEVARTQFCRLDDF